MTQELFEKILKRSCEVLTAEARATRFTSSSSFEQRVREVLSETLVEFNDATPIDFDPHPQAFPDIAVGECGAEVKFTTSDTWKSIANSVLESQRIESVKHIYIVFGKMGGRPEVRWADYEQSVTHVRTSHVPRFEVELDPENRREPLFQQMHIAYDAFRKLPMQEKMKYIRAYARKIHPDGRLWWVEDETSSKQQHTLPIQVRLYTKLEEPEKKRLRAEAALLCPGIVRSSRARDKYDDVALFLLTYHGVVCHQARDLYTAGSVANPKNDDNGGVYMERALLLLEREMIEAAREMDGALFLEYWGEDVPPARRLRRWLQKADRLATDWTPSRSLFLHL